MSKKFYNPVVTSSDVSSILGSLSDIDTGVNGATGVVQEQPDVSVDITAINASETNVFNLATASTRYIVRSLRIKAVDPGANTITVRLYKLIKDVLTAVDTFEITTANYDTNHSLMDMFGVEKLAGDNIKVTVQVDAGGPYAVTGQYSYSKTNN